MDRLEQLKENKEYDDEAMEQIKSWESDARLAKAYGELENNEIIQIIIKDFTEDIEKINDELMNKEDMSMEDRSMKFAERKWRQGFIDKFNFQRATLLEINNKISEELE